MNKGFISPEAPLSRIPTQVVPAYEATFDRYYAELSGQPEPIAGRPPLADILRIGYELDNQTALHIAERARADAQAYMKEVSDFGTLDY